LYGFYCGSIEADAGHATQTGPGKALFAAHLSMYVVV
jgi:hypothetical protein